jgi:hypothetical protein
MGFFVLKNLPDHPEKILNFRVYLQRRYFLPRHYIFAVVLAAAHLFGPFNNINLRIFPSAGYSI